MFSAQKLLIVARVNHYRHEGKLYSYSPYAREIDIWADLFSEVWIAGTCLDEIPPGDCTPFTRSNIRVLPVTEAGGDGFKAKLRQLFILPKIIWQLAGYMRRADAIHARCPCDLGLLGTVMGPIFSRRLIAKYATQWLPYDGEPWTWRLQRRILRSSWWCGPTTVYGKWPDQPEKIIPFFTSMLTYEQIHRAQISAARPRDPNVFRILFVGRLSSAKNVDVLLRAISMLKTEREIECHIVGEGPERAKLEKLATELGIGKLIKFIGGIGFDHVLDFYEKAEALVLASDVEGWPKAIAEGMAFGLVCIGTERGMMPQMLGDERGLLVPARDAEALAVALQRVVENPNESRAMAARAALWAQKYSLDGLREALRNLMDESWEVSIPNSPMDREINLQPVLAASPQKTLDSSN